jgi:predicted metal-dependent hydrolase
VRHRRARRYILRLLQDGSARVTLPRWGTLAEAEQFARANTRWLEAQLVKQANRPREDTRWRAGTFIHVRGQLVPIEVHEGELRFGDHSCRVAGLAEDSDLKPYVQRNLWRMACAELPARVEELARANGLTVRRVSVRNQRSRWGSCSRRGTVSLNWRLVQTPDYVRDYIILHELAHMKEMNHSRRFWAEVRRLCPDFPAAEQWLKQHSKLLR